MNTEKSSTGRILKGSYLSKIHTLAAVQPLSAKARRVNKLKNKPEGRTQHFWKYNLCAAAYDEVYCREYAEEYLGYLERDLVRSHGRVSGPS